MLQNIVNQGLTRCALHLQQHSQLFRLSSIAIIKNNFSHPSSCCTLPARCSGEKSHSTYSAGNGNNSRWEYKRNAWYGKQMGTLVGAVGTVAALGLGTVLSKSLEEREGDENEAVKAVMKKSVENEAQLGKDVVGTERRHKDEEATESPSARLRVDPSDSRDVVNTRRNPSTYEERVRRARQILRRYTEEVGAPGIVVAVTVNGKQVWADGLGFADLENGVRCSPATVMRIASISKALTMTAVAKLWEDGKLDLDAPIQKYIPTFPIKTYNGEEVTITTRQLISHKSGIRHYKQKDTKERENKRKKSDRSQNDTKIESQSQNEGSKATAVLTKHNQTSVRKESMKEGENISININISKTDSEEEKAVVTQSSENENVSSNKTIKEEESEHEKSKYSCRNHIARRRRNKKKKEEEEEDEFDLKEYYIKEEYETVEEALKLFKDDELFFKPGEGYLYTTHGWTVVSAVVEAVAQVPFTEVAKRLFYELGLSNTYLDVPSTIIYNRASYYIRDKHSRLKNAPYVDNSYKWAGGGFLSTVGDLCKFGNVMLYASQHKCEGDGGETTKLPGYLKASTIQQLWTPVDGTRRGWQDVAYGMGWQAVEDKHLYEFCRDSRHHAFHSGTAVGASSMLLVLPQEEPSSAIPQGVVVALMTNMQSVGLHKVALEIAELFEEVQ